ncbi:MAG: peptidoglycan DD-metalloendopeptidase family protein [Thermoleophilia bacterium]|nr:peptidoglycan DD-metalloendopeptidase family protein [Thermoleophilia bacterium]
MVLISTSALGRLKGVVRPAAVALATFLLVTAVLAGMASTTPNRAAASSLTETKADASAARKQLSRLQAELDDLAGKYSKAEARLYEIDNAVVKAEKDEARSRQDLEKMRAQLSERVVRLYKTGHGSTPAFLELLFEEHDFSVLIERLSMLNKVAVQDGETFTQVRTHIGKVTSLQRDLSAKRAAQTTQLNDLQSTQATMESRMQATAAEYKRLKKRVVALEEAARREREAAKARAQAKATGSGGSGGSGGSAPSVKGFVFPVDGPHSYTNDWGFARSGGRSHQGTDIMAARGTPAVAVVSGRIRRTAYGSGLGGTTIWLNGNNGTSYYYAHLDGIAGGISPGTSVAAGQTIGYVGDSGNARGGACHLHFEIHPGGGGASNPYYVLRASD